MKKIFSWAVFACVCCAFIIYVLFQNSNIKTVGERNLPILSNDVYTYFDEYGIPHIEAKSAEDAYRSLGVIMAKERLFQMDLLRRLVNGTFSEIFGEKTIEIDKLMRVLRLKETALKIEKNNLSPEVRKYLIAFLEGVHTVIDSDTLPMEFQVLGYGPAHFSISDILGVSGYMALSFAEGINADIISSEILEKLPEEKMRVLRLEQLIDERFYQNNASKEEHETVQSIQKSLNDLSEIIPLFHGSNSWVLAGKRSLSGYPILANDPHISISNPHIFYEAHLKFEENEIYGHFIPLAPFPILGHTLKTAWAITMSEIDDVTLYQEKINPENPDEYLYKDEWLKLETKDEVIKVKGQKNIEITLRTSIHGPILNHARYESEGKVLAFNWSYYHPENNLFQSLYELPLARSVEEFKNAVSHAASPGLNLSWVNKEGDIAWWVMGKYPKLPENTPYDSVLAGWTGEQEIQSWTSIDENPHLVNPDNGVIVTANYKPQGKEYAHFQGYWQPAGRQYEIEKLLSKQDIWSLEELKDVQTNTMVPDYNEYISPIISVLEKEALNSYEVEVLNILKTWDGYCELESIGCSIFSVLNLKMGENIFIDELGEKTFKALGKTSRYWITYQHLIKHMENPFWDNIKTERVESGAEVVSKSFREALSFLQEKFGQRFSNWEWERLHTVAYEHPLGKVTPLNYIFNIRQRPVKGNRYSINNIGQSVYSDRFNVVVAPATRRLIDMGYIKESFGILPTGNSGNPFSEYFNDQSFMYRNGLYRLQMMDWKKIKLVSPLIFSSGN